MTNNTKVREVSRNALGRHWFIVTDNIVVADVYGKHGSFRLVVRQHAAESFTGAKVQSFPTLAEAEAAYLEGVAR